MLRAKTIHLLKTTSQFWHSLRLRAKMSLVLCLATTTLWLCTYFRTFELVRYWRSYDGDAGHSLELWLKPDRIVFAHTTWGRGGNAGVSYAVNSFNAHTDFSGEPDVEKSCLGFGWLTYESPPDMVYSFLRAASIPFWLLTLLLAIPPALYLRKRIAHPQGTCPSCGYDLRATPNRCTECGIKFASSTK